LISVSLISKDSLITAASYTYPFGLIREGNVSRLWSILASPLWDFVGVLKNMYAPLQRFDIKGELWYG